MRARALLDSAQSIVTARDANKASEEATGDEAEDTATEGQPVEQHAVSAEFDPTSDVSGVKPSEEMTAEGYDAARARRSNAFC